MQLTKKKFSRIGHIGFWTIFLFISFFFFSNFWSLKMSILRAVLNGSLFIFVFYVNLRLLIPFFWARKRHFLYVLTSFGLFAIFFLLRIFFRETLFGEPAGIISARRPFQSEFLIVTSFFFVFGISIFYELVRNYFEAAGRSREILRQRDEAELQMLKSQVNPHFLFNTLNNLYTLAYTRSEKTADAIMSLSEIMRYLIYEAGAPMVPAEKDIRFLTNYVALEKLRIEDPLKVTLVIEKPEQGLMVAPLIFIAFVENAFKHSGIDFDPEGFIQIFLSFRSGEIFFTVENSLPPGGVSEKTGGVGLTNARSRLELMYPGKVNLEIKKSNLVYAVSLIISL